MPLWWELKGESMRVHWLKRKVCNRLDHDISKRITLVVMGGATPPTCSITLQAVLLGGGGELLAAPGLTN